MGCLATVLFVIWKTFHKNLVDFINVVHIIVVHISPPGLVIMKTQIAIIFTDKK